MTNRDRLTVLVRDATDDFLDWAEAADVARSLEADGWVRLADADLDAMLSIDWVPSSHYEWNQLTPEEQQPRRDDMRRMLAVAFGKDMP